MACRTLWSGLTDRASAAATDPRRHYPTFLTIEAPTSCMRWLGVGGLSVPRRESLLRFTDSFMVAVDRDPLAAQLWNPEGKRSYIVIMWLGSFSLLPGSEYRPGIIGQKPLVCFVRMFGGHLPKIGTSLSV
jgi:hypothetical protein